MGASTRLVFFYGLFMDVEVLRARGLSPGPAQHAIVPGFAIRIGQRATLIEASNAEVHGMVIPLAPQGIEALYAEPGVRDYRPRAIQAVLDDGEEIVVLAYVLPVPPREGERNPEYAAKLRALCARLGFPAGYVDSIR
jgi:hypothetical protein